VEEDSLSINMAVHDNTIYYYANDSKTSKEFHYFGPDVPDPDPENLHFFDQNDITDHNTFGHACHLTFD
jgi:hypothetical protein